MYHEKYFLRSNKVDNDQAVFYPVQLKRRIEKFRETKSAKGTTMFLLCDLIFKER